MKKITRTIKYVQVSYMVFNGNEVEEKTVYLDKAGKNPARKIRKMLSSGEQFLKITDSAIIEKKYEISIEDFVKYGREVIENG